MYQNNIEADPCFVDANGPDGTAGTEDDDLHIKPGFPASPCIDAGDNSSVPPDTADLDGDSNTTEPTPWDIDCDSRFVDGNDSNIVDMGSDELVWDGAEGISPIDPPVTLNPGGGPNDPNIEALVVFDNNSVSDDANVTVVETSSNPNPTAEGFGTLGSTLRIDTSLADGEFFMTIVIPFDSNDLDGLDPLSLNLMYYDTASETWILAVQNNTEGPGTRWQEVAPADPAPTLQTLADRDLGDYGVFWNLVAGHGFVWANVDHTTDFAIALLTCDFEPDGDVDFVDFAKLARYWQQDEASVDIAPLPNGDGIIDYLDLIALTKNWLAGVE